MGNASLSSCETKYMGLTMVDDNSLALAFANALEAYAYYILYPSLRGIRGVACLVLETHDYCYIPRVSG